MGGVSQKIGDQSETFWNSFGGKMPSININTQKYDKAFVGFVMLFGLYTTAKVINKGIKYTHNSLVNGRPLKTQKFQQRYGKESWAVIADVSKNQRFCIYLANKGLKLVLMGDQEDIRIIRSMLDFQCPSCQTLHIPINWVNMNFQYSTILDQIKDLDLSFLVLPRIPKLVENNEYGSHVEPIYPFEHHFFLLREIGPLLKNRKFQGIRSAIIFPSASDCEEIRKGYGIYQGVVAGIDALVRTIRYENQDDLDVICCRGTVQECFIQLGKNAVSN